jgi:hypothetical protein
MQTSRRWRLSDHRHHVSKTNYAQMNERNTTTMSRPLPENDPARWMLEDDFTTTPTVHDPSCYICRDPEFAQMGLPLCRPCPYCSMKQDGKHAGHVPADDTVCTVCGEDTYPPEYQPIEGVPVVTSLPDIAEYVPPTSEVTLAQAKERLRERIEADRKAHSK